LTRGQRPLETHADDLTAVLDDLGSRRAALFAVQESASIAMLVAASYPQRVSKLIVMNTSATWSTTDETPWEWSDDEWEVELRLQRTWGSRSWAVGWA
jgi:pimeloyl-ACP methyl ester carboxylesterase